MSVALGKIATESAFMDHLLSARHSVKQGTCITRIHPNTTLQGKYCFYLQLKIEETEA